MQNCSANRIAHSYLTAETTCLCRGGSGHIKDFDLSELYFDNFRISPPGNAVLMYYPLPPNIFRVSKIFQTFFTFLGGVGQRMSDPLLILFACEHEKQFEIATANAKYSVAAPGLSRAHPIQCSSRGNEAPFSLPEHLSSTSEPCYPGPARLRRPAQQVRIKPKIKPLPHLIKPKTK